MFTADWLLIVIMVTINCTSAKADCGNTAVLLMVTEKQCKSSLVYVRQHAKSVTCIDPQGKTYVMRDDELFKSEKTR